MPLGGVGGERLTNLLGRAIPKIVLPVGDTVNSIRLQVEPSSECMGKCKSVAFPVRIVLISQKNRASELRPSPDCRGVVD